MKQTVYINQNSNRIIKGFLCKNHKSVQVCTNRDSIWQQQSSRGHTIISSFQPSILSSSQYGIDLIAILLLFSPPLFSISISNEREKLMLLLMRLPNRLAMRAALTVPCTTKSIIEKSLSTAIAPLVVNVTEAGIDNAADVARSPIAGEVLPIALDNVKR